MYSVKPSLNPSAGLGLFVWEATPPNTRLIEFKGRKVSWARFRRLSVAKRAYSILLRSGEVLVGTAGHACFANCAYRDPLRRRNNAKIVEHPDGRVWIRTTRRVPAGGEVLVSYGNEFRYFPAPGAAPPPRPTSPKQSRSSAGAQTEGRRRRVPNGETPAAGR